MAKGGSGTSRWRRGEWDGASRYDGGAHSWENDRGIPFGGGTKRRDERAEAALWDDLTVQQRLGAIIRRMPDLEAGGLLRWLERRTGRHGEYDPRASPRAHLEGFVRSSSLSKTQRRRLLRWLQRRTRSGRSAVPGTGGRGTE